jgi:hypothetical protein
MRRLLPSILLLFFALALAGEAQADRGDKWHGWRGGGERQRDHDQGGPQGRRDPPRDNGQASDNYFLPGDDARNNRDRDRNREPWFGGRREHDRAREGVIRGRMMPLEELENRISRRARGFRIGNPELLMFGGRPVYRIRWRTPDGHILIVFADAETGEVLDIRGR